MKNHVTEEFLVTQGELVKHEQARNRHFDAQARGLTPLDQTGNYLLDGYHKKHVVDRRDSLVADGEALYPSPANLY